MIAGRTLLGAGFVMSGLAETMGPQAAAQTTSASGQPGDDKPVATTGYAKVRGVPPMASTPSRASLTAPQPPDLAASARRSRRLPGPRSGTHWPSHRCARR